MKVAVIGYGRWGRVVAGKLAAMPEADLVAVVDAEFGSLAMAHELHGVATYGSTAEMLDEHEPHLCCVTVPPQHHASVALECLAGGAHVWVTKPMAMSNVEAQAIMAGADAAERKGGQRRAGGANDDCSEQAGARQTGGGAGEAGEGIGGAGFGRPNQSALAAAEARL